MSTQLRVAIQRAISRLEELSKLVHDYQEDASIFKADSINDEALGILRAALNGDNLMPDDDPTKAAEEHANLEVTATMSSDVYALVAGILTAHAEAHPEDQALLGDIKFSRTR
jgi:hypothetical protein